MHCIYALYFMENKAFFNLFFFYFPEKTLLTFDLFFAKIKTRYIAV